ncbi:MAG TPA: rhodanese-like domain-containing protein [Terriglobales bacterium]
MLRALKLGAVIICVVFILSAITHAQDEPFTMLSMQQVSEMLGKRGVYVLDVNDPEIYAKHHLKGAILVADEHLKKYLPKDKNATLIFYCAERRCTGSEIAAREAAKLGYKKIYTMPEGIFGWVRVGRPTESAPASARK